MILATFEILNNYSNFRLKFLFDRRSVLPKESMGQTMQSNDIDENIHIRIYHSKLNDNVEEKNHEDLCWKYIMPGNDIYENNHEDL